MRLRLTNPVGLIAVVAAGLALAGCPSRNIPTQVDRPAAFELLLPERIKIQPWTRPVSFAGNGEADGVEVLLAAYDCFGDETKAIGMLHLELYTRRAASTDRLGERIAFWAVDLNSRDAQTRDWDRSVRFYRLHVRLPEGKLPPERCILAARLQLPEQRRLFDEYELVVERGTAPSARARR